MQGIKVVDSDTKKKVKKLLKAEKAAKMDIDDDSKAKKKPQLKGAVVKRKGTLAKKHITEGQASEMQIG
jgi:hypothetical protein